MARALNELDWPRRTDRLTIRPATMDDAAAVWLWQRDPAVSHWLTVCAPDENAFAEGWGACLPQVVVAESDGRIVATGKIEVQNAWSQAEAAGGARDQQAELGWTVDPAVQGRGIGTEVARELLPIAFDGVGVRRVIALCIADNAASWRIMEKIGLRREGLFVAEALHRDGHWVDSLAYALLADEWRARHRALRTPRTPAG
jgi:RimJ/RimL family protein N-acetyltransferase